MDILQLRLDELKLVTYCAQILQQCNHTAVTGWREQWKSIHILDILHREHFTEHISNGGKALKLVTWCSQKNKGNNKACSIKESDLSQK